MKKLFTFIAIIMMMALSVVPNVSFFSAAAQTPNRLAGNIPTNQERQINDVVITENPETSFEIPAERVDQLIAVQAGDKNIQEVVRIFSAGRLIDDPELVLDLEHVSAINYPDSKILLVRDSLRGQQVIEDIHFVDRDETTTVVVRDIYLDGDAADLSVGRGLPVKVDRDEIEDNSLTSATPIISSISGFTDYNTGITNGKVDMSCGSTWNGNYAINDQPGTFWLILNGSNFGTARGSVTLAGNNVNIVSWSNTSIRIDPTLPYHAQVTAILKITTAAGNVLNYALNTVPAIRTRIFGQCTYHVALTRQQMGLNPSPSAYSGYSSITGAYVPRAGDQYQWTISNGKHTAIVVGVSGPVSSTGGVKTWTLTISEQNATCQNAVRSYTTPFQTRTSGATTSVAAYPKASFGNYSCMLYYR